MPQLIASVGGVGSTANFNNAIKEQSTTYQTNYYVNQISSYRSDQVETNLYKWNNFKSFIGEQDSQSPNYSVYGCNISNSVYQSFNETINYDTGHIMAYITYVFAITPYDYMTNTTINLQIYYSVGSSHYDTYLIERYGETTQDLNPLINLTNYNFADIHLNEAQFINPTTRNTNLQNDTQATYVRNLTLTIDDTSKTYYLAYQAVIRNNTINTYSRLSPQGSTLVINGDSSGGATGDYVVVDIPNLMFTTLTLPFSFISQSFNLTLFPNTPYALNVSNLFLTILATLILLWLIKRFKN